MTFPAHTDPILLRPGEGEYAIIGGNSRCTFKVTGRDTANHFGLFEFEMEAGETSFQAIDKLLQNPPQAEEPVYA